MKRGSGLKRLTRLRAKTPMPRGGGMHRAAMKVKPPKKTVAEVLARERIQARSGGCCEVCGLHPATNVHHRQGRRIRNPWRLSNLLHLCGSGSTGCHGDITEHRVSDYVMGWSVHRNRPVQPEDVSCFIWCGENWGFQWVRLTDDSFVLMDPKPEPEGIA